MFYLHLSVKKPAPSTDFLRLVRQIWGKFTLPISRFLFAIKLVIIVINCYFVVVSNVYVMLFIPQLLDKIR